MGESGDRVAIVGGGVIGACSAYYLSDKGYRVTILEKESFGGGCSHGNCGLVCPSHVRPLSVPEALTKPLRSMFGSQSPFYVNPLVGPALWGWLLRFAMNCTPAKSLEAARARHNLLSSSMELWQQMIADESISCEWRRDGLLFVHTSTKSMENYAKTNDYLDKNFGLSARHYDARAVVALEPALRDDVAGGWYYEGDAHLRPDKAMSELRRVLEGRGVRIIENAPVTDIRLESRRAVAVRMADTRDGTAEEVECDHLVVATGARAPELGRALGLRLHIQPGKGYSLTTDHPDPCPRIPMILEDHSVAVTPFESGFRLGSTMEFTGYDDKLNRTRLGLLESGARNYLRDVKGARLEEEWFGWRPMSATGIPAIGPSPNVANAYVAAGHSMLGMSMGPATGKLVSEIIAGEQPHLDSTPYAPQKRGR